MKQYRLTAGSRVGPDDNGKYVLWLDAVTAIFKKGQEYQTELVDKNQELAEQDEALIAKEKTIIDLRSKVAAQELRADDWRKAGDALLTQMQKESIAKGKKVLELDALLAKRGRQQRETTQDLVERGMISDEHSRRLIQEATSKGQETNRLAYRIIKKDTQIVKLTEAVDKWKKVAKVKDEKIVELNDLLFVAGQQRQEKIKDYAKLLEFMDDVREKARDRNPDGITILDFIAVWNEQYQDTIAKKDKEIKELKAEVKRLRDEYVRRFERIEDLEKEVKKRDNEISDKAAIKTHTAELREE